MTSTAKQLKRWRLATSLILPVTLCLLCSCLFSAGFSFILSTISLSILSSIALSIHIIFALISFLFLIQCVLSNCLGIQPGLIFSSILSKSLFCLWYPAMSYLFCSVFHCIHNTHSHTVHINICTHTHMFMQTNEAVGVHMYILKQIIHVEVLYKLSREDLRACCREEHSLIYFPTTDICTACV